MHRVYAYHVSPENQYNVHVSVSTRAPDSTITLHFDSYRIIIIMYNIRIILLYLPGAYFIFKPPLQRTVALTWQPSSVEIQVFSVRVRSAV